jgi:hypothetical protein
MPKARFFLNISADEIQKYYRGEAKTIVATTVGGKRIQFPANLVLPYVSHSGIVGSFILNYHNNGKAISLIKE